MTNQTPVATIVRDDGYTIAAYSETELQLHRAAHDQNGWDYTVFRPDPQPTRITTPSAAQDTIARHIIAAAAHSTFASGHVDWSDYPDIDEQDMVAITERATQLAPYPQADSLHDAYQHLTQRAEGST